MSVTTEGSASATAIRPFRVEFPEAALEDLRARLAATRFPERETVSDSTQGAQLAKVQELVDYWATDYDWRKLEAKLNALPQFITEIDGLDIHFFHVRSPHANALPLIMTHGWPGSFLEFVKVIGPLSDPESHGARAEDAFDLVVPSMPGYGFSARPQATGWNAERIAGAWVELMRRLGYGRYVSQGGDWGALVTDVMGRQAPEGLLGIHVTTLFGAIQRPPTPNTQATVPPEVANALKNGEPAPAGLSAEETAAYEGSRNLATGGSGFRAIRPRARKRSATRSRTRRSAWPLGFTRSSRNGPTRTANPSARSRRMRCSTTSRFTGSRTQRRPRPAHTGRTAPTKPRRGEVSIPAAVSGFPGEIIPVPRSWAERAYPNLVYFNKLEKGGHFAAWEQPELFAGEMRAAFRSLR